MAPHFPAPTVDPEQAEVARMLPDPRTEEDQDMLENFLSPDPTSLLAGNDFRSEDHTIPVRNGEIVLSVIRSATSISSRAACIYYIHGGGVTMGTRWLGIDGMIDSAPPNTVFVTVQYRLAPQHPDPTPIEDSYAGLLWTVEHASALGIDPSKLLLAGGSAGGGICAGLALLSRDRDGLKACGQLLICPMLDDRNETLSGHQNFSPTIYTRDANLYGWTSLLGDRRGKEGVSIYAAPGRADDLSDLPPAFLDVGSAEIFRDEVVKYADKLWECGGDAELHVWPGAFHGFSGLAPKARVSMVARKTRNDWIHRVLGCDRSTK